MGEHETGPVPLRADRLYGLCAEPARILVEDALQHRADIIEDDLKLPLPRTHRGPYSETVPADTTGSHGDGVLHPVTVLQAHHKVPVAVETHCHTIRQRQPVRQGSRCGADDTSTETHSIAQRID